jgi:hypothetical protein
MSEWQDKTDPEINKAVTRLENDLDGWELSSCGKFFYMWSGGGRVKTQIPVNDYCNNPSDSWPIIFDNRISVEYDRSEGLWISHSGDYLMGHFVSESRYRYQIRDKNPLRAAMIVYLEMNGVKP